MEAIKTRKSKIDIEEYKNLRGQGVSQADSYLGAGGSGKTRAIVASNASIYEKRYQMKGDIIKLLQEKRKVALRALSPQKARKESFKNLVLSIGMLTEKIQLLEGKPTSQTATAVRLYLPEHHE